MSASGGDDLETIERSSGDQTLVDNVSVVVAVDHARHLDHVAVTILRHLPEAVMECRSRCRLSSLMIDNKDVLRICAVVRTEECGPRPEDHVSIIDIADEVARIEGRARTACDGCYLGFCSV